MLVVVVCVLGGGGRKTGSGKQAVTTEPGQRLEDLWSADWQDWNWDFACRD